MQDGGQSFVKRSPRRVSWRTPSPYMLASRPNWTVLPSWQLPGGNKPWPGRERWKASHPSSRGPGSMAVVSQVDG